ncbi:hypothetical protein IAE22_30995, partial [Bacillus sp. S34]|nr:hypothetical protein [Bacillus sp. S34]
NLSAGFYPSGHMVYLDGGNETFAVFDETHLYVKPELREMFSTLVRNLEKRRGSTGTWYLETTTMYRPGQDSIAEQTYNAADLIEDGRLLVNRQLFDQLEIDGVEFLDDPVDPERGEGVAVEHRAEVPVREDAPAGAVAQQGGERRAAERKERCGEV